MRKTFFPEWQVFFVNFSNNASKQELYVAHFDEKNIF